MRWEQAQDDARLPSVVRLVLWAQQHLSRHLSFPQMTPRGTLVDPAALALPVPAATTTVTAAAAAAAPPALSDSDD